MPDTLQMHVEVYAFRRVQRRVEFLCLRRSAQGSLPGIWQPVTGSKRRGERAVAAAVRELFEETGVRPLNLWALETVTTYFDAAADVVRLLPLFAAEIGPKDPVRLSSEHDAFRFLGSRAAGNLFLWEAQRRGLEAVRREVLMRPALARALHVKIPTRHLTRTRPQ